MNRGLDYCYHPFEISIISLGVNHSLLPTKNNSKTKTKTKTKIIDYRLLIKVDDVTHVLLVPLH